MKTVTLLASLACLSFSDAAPNVQPGSIGAQCRDVRIHERTNWLIGDCRTDPDDIDSPRITTGTWLVNKIWNNDSALSWNGGDYQSSCSNCTLLYSGSVLSCECKPNTGAKQTSWLNLDDHIGIYLGHMLSDLYGPPTIPTTPSKYPFPSTPRYSVNGNLTCIDPEAPPAPTPTWPPPPSDGYDWCGPKGNPKQCVDAATNSTNLSGWLIENGPVRECYVPWELEPAVFNQFQLKAEGAWELTGYADKKCQRKLITIGPEMRGLCHDLKGEFVRAYTARPLFDGDPN
ncbi:hypothetical protein K458DRAFT_385025 [Lentithecium fluviatile CBS 122367]|uniref:Cyanovirin-N domain-containing protein n=1 Tax=Lentithecium fluviatile CBS 122367 TaxID=1168545 RepID=A0A6G1JF44_9PLEO|nr:hypothetical protein K458DRAFT_385025 [Lentithecium fluviatile CBS 122367]